MQFSYLGFFSKPDAEEIEARVQMMSPADIRSDLRNQRLPDKPDVSVWDYLNNKRQFPKEEGHRQ